MEIQQHDDVVVEATMISAGLRQVQGRWRSVTGGRGRGQGLWCAALPPPPLYKGCLGGAPALGDPISRAGVPPLGALYIVGGGQPHQAPGASLSLP